eukprot:m.225954 g.225954  ORF g.225954 m.225954 type:complete len:83 (+) comp15656_c0_seq3:6614-6862(+)
MAVPLAVDVVVQEILSLSTEDLAVLTSTSEQPSSEDATLLLQVLDDAVKGRSELHESIIAANIKQRVDQQRREIEAITESTK